MPTSVPGSSRAGRRAPRCAGRGFTLVELLVVIAIVALTAGLVSLALRDSGADRLEREAVRLAALLEAARAESRATGLAVWWVPGSGEAAGTEEGFRFVGLPPSSTLPQRWLDADVRAEVIGPPQVVLGPEALIGAQQIVLRLGPHRVDLTTDGLGPFTVAPAADGAGPA